MEEGQDWVKEGIKEVAQAPAHLVKSSASIYRKVVSWQALEQLLRTAQDPNNLSRGQTLPLSLRRRARLQPPTLRLV
ncbi:hypothetical protein A2419_03115 [Candidatus Adlerbacteria bacterium RIFOXYC1_FULL_48_26]|uniref:Uncharacterized protein n=1 Tax=Candidatus Adlerbacteria bacterium RIFOXYC1_FULL_48_26 TaxID=1797247 RepID=A0A1F4Y415_9BACT|nr:MAG: hypothetical protein A2419_03115 [Candidatus Adlerbacteria bacterium RIFOXYC1_FULL_48_26]OGC93318.1 MAG: hypothetical protein A2389_01710 [Candidatus Adlerbacteria bacterium RIFOXYB1_FULL_48_10]OGC95150.1 MAG: hypothetical protein A2590_01880 [Candidatus Adlerbacteria bacterium RIFOXYD1_FULL_48_8]